MEVIICLDEQVVGWIVVDWIVKVLGWVKVLVLGVVIGLILLMIYFFLVVLVVEGKVDFIDLCVFVFDEYIGFFVDDECFYVVIICYIVIEQLGFDLVNVYIFDGMVDDFDVVCVVYEIVIQEVDGVDVQIFGIGVNGYIGFNEFISLLFLCICVKIFVECIKVDNVCFFEEGEKVLSYCVIQGFGIIMDVCNVVLLVIGVNKVDVLVGVVEGFVLVMCLVLVLQFYFYVLVIVDDVVVLKFIMVEYF